MEAFVGELRPLAFNYAPRGWLPCIGDLHNPASYPQLAQLLGTRFGGVPGKSFAVPNLMSQAMMGMGTGTDGISYQLGQVVGETAITLTGAQLPQHTHQANALLPTQLSGEYLHQTPQNGDYPTSFLNAQAKLASAYHNTTPPIDTVAMSDDMIDPLVGGAQPHENRQPYLAIGWFICAQGTYPQAG